MSDPQLPPKFLKHKDKIYEVIDNDLYRTFQELDKLEEGIPNLEWRGAKIPFEMWQDVVNFMVYSYNALKSETLAYLFYDTDENAWAWWVPPQKTYGMSLDSNPENPEWDLQRPTIPGIVFGTVHHHCSTSAFQSGTDEIDERDRDGIHITVGHCDQPDKLSIHCRFVLGSMQQELPLSRFIEPPEHLRNAFSQEQIDTFGNAILQQAIMTATSGMLSVANPPEKDERYDKMMLNVEKTTKTYVYNRYSANTSTAWKSGTPATGTHYPSTSRYPNKHSNDYYEDWYAHCYGNTEDWPDYTPGSSNPPLLATADDDIDESSALVSASGDLVDFMGDEEGAKIAADLLEWFEDGLILSTTIFRSLKHAYPSETTDLDSVPDYKFVALLQQAWENNKLSSLAADVIESSYVETVNGAFEFETPEDKHDTISSELTLLAALLREQLITNFSNTETLVDEIDDGTQSAELQLACTD